MITLKKTSRRNHHLLRPNATTILGLQKSQLKTCRFIARGFQVKSETSGAIDATMPKKRLAVLGLMGVVFRKDEWSHLLVESSTRECQCLKNQHMKS
jgi:hypothetical protein